MDPSQFDRISKLLARHRLSRRTALHAGTGALAAAAFAGAAGGRETTEAQGAATPSVRGTPRALPAPKASFPKGATDATYMFVQGFEKGALAPKVGSADSFALTLSGGLGHTVGFSDRPKRSFGVLPTKRFLASFPFGPKNPPNAALVMETGAEQEAIAVVELTNPAYDEATHTATYDATVRADYQQLGISFQETPKTAAGVPSQFGPTSVFIDDCPNEAMICTTPDAYLLCENFGSIDVGYCWHYFPPGCQPCRDYSSQCNATFSACGGQCEAMTLSDYCNGGCCAPPGGG